MQAKFSLRHCAAAAVIFRRVGTDELAEEVLARPDVVELRDRVKVVRTPALGKHDAEVELAGAGGAGHGGAPQSRHPAAPLGDAESARSSRSSDGLGVRTNRAVAPRPAGAVGQLPESRLLSQTVPAADD